MSINPASKHFLALDIGASNGRAVLGSLRNGVLNIKEIRRFPNIPLRTNESLCWDFASLWENVIESLRACAKMGCGNLNGIGVDTWGVDFGLIGKDGNLLGNPVHYRDSRTNEIGADILSRMNNLALYRLTGLSFMQISTLAQLVGFMKKGGSAVLKKTKTLLFMPDLFRYFLCGIEVCDRTIAGTSLLVNINKNSWSRKIFRTFHVPERILPPLVNPGVQGGRLLTGISEKTGIRQTSVFVVAGHDTPSAAAAIPCIDNDSLFLSCGTWAVLGVVSSKPIIKLDAIDKGYVNETGFESNLFVKNMMGLYLFELYHSALNTGGQKVSYVEMEDEAAQAKPFQRFLNPNDQVFFAASNVEEAVQNFFCRTNQKMPHNRSIVFMTLLEGLAFSCRHAISDLERLLDKKFRRLFMVGGGCRNRLLCQFIADAAGIEVISGPAEATAIGNLCIQAFAAGELQSPNEIRNLVASSFELAHHKPQNAAQWEKNYIKYREVIRGTK